jgi:hypothetical protein
LVYLTTRLSAVIELTETPVKKCFIFIRIPVIVGFRQQTLAFLEGMSIGNWVRGIR